MPNRASARSTHSLREFVRSYGNWPLRYFVTSSISCWFRPVSGIASAVSSMLLPLLSTPSSNAAAARRQPGIAWTYADDLPDPALQRCAECDPVAVHDVRLHRGVLGACHGIDRAARPAPAG